jgi:hypothetical protein
LVVVWEPSLDNEFPRLGLVFSSLGISVVVFVIDAEKFKLRFSTTGALAAIVGDDLLFLPSGIFPVSFSPSVKVSFSPGSGSFCAAGLAV